MMMVVVVVGGGYDFCPWSTMYMVKSGIIGIGFEIQNLGDASGVPSFSFKIEVQQHTILFIVYI